MPEYITNRVFDLFRSSSDLEISEKVAVGFFHSLGLAYRLLRAHALNGGRVRKSGVQAV